MGQVSEVLIARICHERIESSCFMMHMSTGIRCRHYLHLPEMTCYILISVRFVLFSVNFIKNLIEHFNIRFYS
jgi:hypothetical protein